MKIRHYRCPDCGKLCSVPWDSAWCTHHENTQPRPPSWIDSDWTRMLPITRVDTDSLPPEADEWYVAESRNNFGYPNNEIPGEDKRSWKIVAGPLSREDAYAWARSAPRDDVPEHIHSFDPVPGDLIKEIEDYED